MYVWGPNLKLNHYRICIYIYIHICGFSGPSSPRVKGFILGSSTHTMGCSHNHGPFLVIDYIAAPHIQGYQNKTLILGTAHLSGSASTKAIGLLGGLRLHHSTGVLRGCKGEELCN